LWQNDMILEDVLRESQEAVVINSVLDLEHQRRAELALKAEVVRSVGRR
jgi:hypothetical protein